jgi:hypothetical protein
MYWGVTKAEKYNPKVRNDKTASLYSQEGRF